MPAPVIESKIHLMSRHKNIIAFIAISVIILVLYSNTFDASWHLDDGPNILDGTRLRLIELNWPNIKQTFFNASERLYRPVPRLSFALNYYFGKDNIFGYHLVNITVHILTGFFLFLFIRETLNLPSLKGKYAKTSYLIALLSAILWALNPVQTQAVTYIVQRMACMAGLFYITAMYCYVKGRTSVTRPQSIIYFICCALSALLAFGSKENAFMLPVVLLLYDLILIQENSGENTGRKLKIALPVIFLSVIAGLVYYRLALGNVLSFINAYDVRVFTFKERLLTEPRIIIFYISLLLYPVPTRLSLVHDMPISSSLFAPPGTILSIVCILGVFIASPFIFRKWPLVTYCALFFFLNHVIESSIFPLELVFEHRNYIPSMLFFLPVAIGILKGIDFYSNKKSMRSILIVFTALAIAGLGHSTYLRNFTWKDDESLWKDCIEKAPGAWRSYHNLGAYYSRHNMSEEAIPLYKEALTKKCIANVNDKARTYYNLGLESHNAGDITEALRYYSKAIEINPRHAFAHNNIGMLLADGKDYDEACEAFAKVISLRRGYHLGYSNLGFLFLKMGKDEEALEALKTALELAPDDVPTLLRLGFAYKEQGEFRKALIHFGSVLKQKPRNLTALLFVGEIYSTLGDHKLAVKMIARASEIISEEDLKRFVEDRDSFEMLMPDMDRLLPILAEVAQDKAQYYIKISKDYHNNTIRKK